MLDAKSSKASSRGPACSACLARSMARPYSVQLCAKKSSRRTCSRRCNQHHKNTDATSRHTPGIIVLLRRCSSHLFGYCMSDGRDSRVLIGSLQSEFLVFVHGWLSTDWGQEPVSSVDSSDSWKLDSEGFLPIILTVTAAQEAGRTTATDKIHRYSTVTGPGI